MSSHVANQNWRIVKDYFIAISTGASRGEISLEYHDLIALRDAIKNAFKSLRSSESARSEHHPDQTIRLPAMTISSPREGSRAGQPYTTRELEMIQNAHQQTLQPSVSKYSIAGKLALTLNRTKEGVLRRFQDLDALLRATSGRDRHNFVVDFTQFIDYDNNRKDTVKGNDSQHFHSSGSAGALSLDKTGTAYTPEEVTYMVREFKQAEVSGLSLDQVVTVIAHRLHRTEKGIRKKHRWLIASGLLPSEERLSKAADRSTPAEHVFPPAQSPAPSEISSHSNYTTQTAHTATDGTTAATAAAATASARESRKHPRTEDGSHKISTKKCKNGRYSAAENIAILAAAAEARVSGADLQDVAERIAEQLDRPLGTA